MSAQQPAPFAFWWPTSETGGKVMHWLLGVIGVLVFIKGCIDEELGYEIKSSGNPAGTIASILFFYVALNIAGWYFIFNICRFVYHRINRSETAQTIRETRREKAELESLRRRREIKQLKDELGTDAERNGSRWP
jgi:hypothetical protein